MDEERLTKGLRFLGLAPGGPDDPTPTRLGRLAAALVPTSPPLVAVVSKAGSGTAPQGSSDRYGLCSRVALEAITAALSDKSAATAAVGVALAAMTPKIDGMKFDETHFAKLRDPLRTLAASPDVKPELRLLASDVATGKLSEMDVATSLERPAASVPNKMAEPPPPRSVQPINDAGVSPDPRDYYFHAADYGNDIGTVVVVCPKAFFDRHGYLYDQHLSLGAGGTLDIPYGEIAEAEFEFPGTVTQAEAAFVALGMTREPRLVRP